MIRNLPEAFGMQENKEQMSINSKMSCKSAEENRNTHQLSISMRKEHFFFFR